MRRTGVKRAIIAGGGIAGPVLGMFLRRIGAEATVLEARPAMSEDEGAFLGVAPNGMNVLAALGLADEVAARGVVVHGMRFENARGRTIGAIDHAANTANFGAPLIMIRRGVLHAALVAAARAQGVEVRFGARLEDLDQDATGVTAHLHDGAELRGDVLIGCDGLRSRTRALVLPDAPAPAYTGLVDFGGFARCPAAPLQPGWNVMVFGRRAFFGAFMTADGEVWWFHNAGERVPSGVVDLEARRAEILALHHDDPAWIGEVVRATPTLLGPWLLHDIMTMPRWHHGRVCLIGDAAHATSPSAGQGASLALEDAMMLARCLRDADDPARAFTTFAALRRPRVEAIVRQSRRNGDGKAPSGPIAEWLRDRALPLFLRLGAAAQARAYAYRIDWDAPATRA